MNDTDDRIRTMLRTAIGVPTDPPIENELMHTIAAENGPTHRGARIIGVAAALLCVATAGAAVTWSTTSAPAEQAPASAIGLDQYYLPAEIPAGWTLVDAYLDQDQGTLWSNDAAVVQRHDGSDVAVVTVTEAAGTIDREAAEWSVSDRSLTWREAGRQYTLFVRSGDEASARSAASAIHPPASRASSLLDVDPGSEWDKTDEQRDARWTMRVDVLVLADDAGRTITITRTPPAPDLITTWLSRSAVTDPVVEPIGASEGLTAWGTTRGGDSLLALASDPSVSEVAKTLVGGLVQRSADEWAEARPDTRGQVEAATTVAESELIDHRVTVHRSLPWQGICVERNDGTRGCAYTPVGADGSVDLASIPAGVRLSDESWVAVASIPPGAAMCDAAGMNASQLAVDEESPIRIALIVPRSLSEPVSCVLEGPVGGTFLIQPPHP